MTNSGYVFGPMNEGPCAVVAWRYVPGLEFARRRFYPAGSRRVEFFTRSANGDEHPFLLMTREA